LAVSAKKQTAKSAADALRRIQSELRGIVTDRGQVVSRIDEIRTSSQVDYGAVRREREQKIAQLENQLKEQTTHCRTLEFSAAQFRLAVSTQQEVVTELKAEEREIQRKHETADRKLRELASSRSNNLRRFANWMPTLVRRIEEAHRNGRFHAKPRGPIGANIRLRESRWALAVEKCLGIHCMNL